MSRMQYRPNDDPPLVNVQLPDEARQRFAQIRQRVQKIGAPLAPVADFLESEEWYACWTPAKALIRAYDEEPNDKAAIARHVRDMYGWAENRGGYGPDGVIGANLDADTLNDVRFTIRRRLQPAKLKDALPRELYELVDGKADDRDGRFIRDSRGLAIVRLSDEAARIRPQERERAALAAFAVSDQTERAAQRDLLPGVLAELLEGGMPAADAKIEAMRLIADEYAPAKATGGSGAAGRWRGPEASEVVELANFVTPEGLERLLERCREAGLTPREFELLKILLRYPGISNREAGAHVGMSREMVAVLKPRIRETLRMADIA